MDSSDLCKGGHAKARGRVKTSEIDVNKVGGGGAQKDGRTTEQGRARDRKRPKSEIGSVSGRKTGLTKPNRRKCDSAKMEGAEYQPIEQLEVKGVGWGNRVNDERRKESGDENRAVGEAANHVHVKTGMPELNEGIEK